MATSYLARDVFVPGGRPTVTYQARTGLEKQLRDQLDYGDHGILSVSGPTKTGKTVLVRQVVEDAVFLEGGQIDSFESFCHSILDHFSVPTEFERSISEEDTDGTDRAIKGSAAVLSVDYRRQNSEKTSTTVSTKQSRSPNIATSEALAGGGKPLVIDDFHYVEPSLQLNIVRFLKSLVFDGLTVVLVSVPHRAYDAVRVEREMTGRVTVVEVGFWSNDDLMSIARTGFDALNAADLHELVAHQLVEQTFSSPHLMQQFCLGVCKENSIPGTLTYRQNLSEPTDGWPSFYRGFASSASKFAFDRLARGGRQRQDRLRRELTDGRIVDIYGLVLEAIARTGPTVSIKYETLRAEMRNLIKGVQPQRNQITQVLEKMSEIARTSIEGEPVVDWVPGDDVLHISDPYFAYYLRWGNRETIELSDEE
jgi:hypothetical protein